MTFLKTALLALALPAFMAAYGAENRPSIAATTPEGREITVTAVTDNILRIDNRAKAEAPAPASRTLLTPAATPRATVSDTPSGRTLATSTGLTATLDKATGELIINGSRGRGLYDDGRRGSDSRGRRTMNLIPLDASRAFFGAGERGHSLNLAGDTLVMYNRQNYGYTQGDPRISQMNITMPLIISPKGYAVVVDDYAEAEMVAGNPVEYATTAPYPVSYYFVSSPAGFEGIGGELTEITGRQDLAPFWSLGYITSKYGYKTQEETDSVVNTLKSKGYPLDGIVLDLYWYGKEQDMGRLAWDKEQWPDATGMLRGLKKKGVNLVAISQPYVLRNSRGIDNYRHLDSRHMFGLDSVGNTKEVKIWVGEGGMLDVSNPETRAWLRGRYKQLTDSGITGWWGDLGEPEVHPDGMIHANGLSNRLYHNLYGNDWSRIVYDLFAEEYPDTRLMTMMRGGTVGLQRYSVYPWSTDVSRSWGGLQPQVKIMLNSSLSGLGYMSHDVGGFAIDEAHPYDPELYVRWLQLGTFSPILRTHAQKFAEPYLYPEQEDIILPLIRERYRWLPYNYTLAYENAAKGTPLVRPIGMYASQPERYADVEDEYLWGRDVLIAPVMEAGATSRSVHLPEGIWINANSPADGAIAGDTTLTVSAPLAVLPMFVRAGAIIPKADYPMENTLGYNPSHISVDYYPAEGVEQSTFTMFDDDRTSTHTIDRGQYQLIDFAADRTTDAIRLGASVTGSYAGAPERRTISYTIHNVANPRSVSASQSAPGKEGKTLKLKATRRYDAATRTLRLTVANWQSATPLTIDLRY